MVGRMTREEIEQKMDELARKYVETHDPEIPYEIYRLARQLEELDPEQASLTTHVEPQDRNKHETR
jgi:NAD-dependent DNA ligase